MKITPQLTHKRIVAFLLAALFMLSGVLIGLFINPNNKTSRQYPYLATRLYGPTQDDMIVNFTQLREVMNERYNTKKIPLGVYFEYLPTGGSVGINDQLQVEIGSLSKVPGVMAVYKQIDNGSLDDTAILTISEKDIDSRFGALWESGSGTKLSVAEVVDLTLKKSDNTAANLLVNNLPSGSLQAVFNELDLPKTRVGPYPVMSPKSYSSVFRNLFLSTYLSDKSSNAILEDLTNTDFTDKLPSGVPGEIKVAHKIGVFRIADTQDIYSDCGIVYFPKRPYILCVMVAAEESVAREEINAYSKMVYSYVSQVKASKSLNENSE